MASKKQTEFEVLLEMAAKLDPSYRTAMENARKGVEDVGDGAKDSSKDIDTLDIAVGNLVANGITALISKAGEAVTSLYNMAEETREFRQDMGTLETAFSEANFSVETATDTWKDLYAVFGEDDKAVEAANNIARMADTQEDLNDWVEITTGVWGTYQDALPVEGLAEAAGETAKTGVVTGGLADALNWAVKEGETFGLTQKENIAFVEKSSKELKKMTEAERAEYEAKKKQYEETEAWNKELSEAISAEDKFNIALAECTTEAERQELITSTLMGLYGDAADKYRDTADGVMAANEAQAEYALTQAEFGEKIEPATVAVKEGITNLMNEGLALIGNVDFAAWAGKIESGFDWLINTGLPAIQNGFGWLKSNIPFIAGVVGTLTAAWLTFGGAQKIVTAATNAYKIAQAALNVVMNANPIGLIITGVMLLVTAFVLLWNNCEGFRNFFIGMWEGIKAAAAAVAEWFTGTFVPWISGIWDGIKDAAAKVGEIFTGLKEAWSSAFKGAANAVISVLNWLIDKINTINIGPLPDWDILGQYAGAEIGFNIPRIPELAEGGIATRDTIARIGEGSEPEAVLPLSKLGDLMGGAAGGVSIVYSPNITVMPGANAADVKAATAESFEQFKSYMDRYLRERKRLQFA